MGFRRDLLRRDVISWALYDFANTIYSMNIISLYFSVWLVVDLGFKDINYSVAFSASMLAAALVMPALGYLSDRYSRNRSAGADGGVCRPRGGNWLRRQPKLFLLFLFTAGAITSVIGFAVLPASAIIPVLVLFAFSNFFYEGGMVFYNALIKAVSSESTVATVSGFGVALGYMGSIVGMVLILPFVTGSLFGIEVPFIRGGGTSAAFLPTALFFGLFSIPIFLFVRERPVSPVGSNNSGVGGSSAGSLRAAYRDVWKSLRSTQRYPGLVRFLIADYFFEDAIATVILFMGVFTEKVLGMDSADRTAFFIVSTVFAMAGAYALGHLADRRSPKRILFGIVSGWIIILVLFAFNRLPALVWMMGPIVGILLGGVWAVSRPLLIQLSPPDKLGEFFGLYSLSGRAAAICGPLVWGSVVYLMTPDNAVGGAVSTWLGLDAMEAAKLPYRLAVIALAGMMAVGLFLFRKVPDRKAVP
jgi:UMF1 family MFS transporter